MKTLNVFAIAALLTTGVLLADVAAADTATKTRAQVVAELKQAQDSGELASYNTDDTITALSTQRPAAAKQRAIASAE